MKNHLLIWILLATLPGLFMATSPAKANMRGVAIPERVVGILDTLKNTPKSFRLQIFRDVRALVGQENGLERLAFDKFLATVRTPGLENIRLIALNSLSNATLELLENEILKRLRGYAASGFLNTDIIHRLYSRNYRLPEPKIFSRILSESNLSLNARELLYKTWVTKQIGFSPDEFHNEVMTAFSMGLISRKDFWQMVDFLHENARPVSSFDTPEVIPERGRVIQRIDAIPAEWQGRLRFRPRANAN